MPTSRRFLLRLLAAAPLLRVTTAAAAADEAAARALIERLGEQAIVVLAEKDRTPQEIESRLARLLRTGFDLPFLARLALGHAWRGLSGAQKDEYERLFTDFVLKTYSRRLQGYSGERFAVLGSSAAGRDDVMVRSEIRRPSDTPIRVDWRVRQRDGAARVIDVVVEGVSLIVTQRSEFQAVARQHGVDGLLALLRDRVRQADASAS